VSGGSAFRRRAAAAAAALVVLGLVALGCGRPPDEAWLKFLGFRESGTETTLATIEGDLSSGTADSADAAFTNASITLGTTSGSTGTGITVKRARVEYKMNGFSPPAEEYPASLYLPASSVSSGTVTAEKATLTGLPLASVSLKRWLLDTHAFDDPISTPTVRLTAQVTFFAETDEGGDLEVSGSIAIVLTNGGAGTEPGTVSIAATDGSADISAGSTGTFTVTRTGPTTHALNVYYSAGGTAEAGVDYTALEGVVVIAADASSATITVTPLSGATAGRTVVVTLVDSASYTVGAASRATVTLVE
jgi:hypothetical protein